MYVWKKCNLRDESNVCGTTQTFKRRLKSVVTHHCKKIAWRPINNPAEKVTLVTSCSFPFSLLSHLQHKWTGEVAALIETCSQEWVWWRKKKKKGLSYFILSFCLFAYRHHPLWPPPTPSQLKSCTTPFNRFPVSFVLVKKSQINISQ